MRTFGTIILLAGLWAGCKGKDKNAAESAKPSVSKHSEAFNAAVGKTLDAYYALTESFVNWDSLSVPDKIKDLQANLPAIPVADLVAENSDKAKASLDSSKQRLQTMLAQTDLTGKRRELNMLTQHLFDFLKYARYDYSKIYLQECPMAFNDVEPGMWLSAVDTIRNPYLGLHHPLYHKAMLECGEHKSKIDFTEK
jgi:hypothetical protein